MSANSYLFKLSNNLVLNTAEKTSIATSIATLKKRLKDHFGDSIIEQIQFGSSTRNTILPRVADDQSDIDYMIVFKDGDSVKPNTLIERLKKFAAAKYSTTEVFKSHPTVVLNLNHIKFELVPAYKTWLSYYIPAPNSSWSEWIATDPNGFNNKLATRNVETNSVMKQMIRLLKYWNAKNGYIYESFLLEKDLVDRYYPFCSSLKDFIATYFDNVSIWSLPQYKKDKAQRAKDIMDRIREYERLGLSAKAEIEISKLFPPL